MIPLSRVKVWTDGHHARPNSEDHKVLDYLAHLGRPRHDARIVGLTYEQIARAVGCCWRTVARVVYRLAGVGRIAIEARPGRAHIYRVLFDWVKPQVEGEQRAEREQPTPDELAALAAEPAPASDSIAFRWSPNLDHHPRL